MMQFFCLLLQQPIANLTLRIPLAIALATVVGCTSSRPSAQTEAVEIAPLESKSKPDTVPASTESANLQSETSSADDREIANPAPLNQSQISEAEMLRREALETAIADENLTRLIGNCRMQACVETYYTFTFLEWETDGERLYQTEVLNYRSDASSSEAVGEWVFSSAPTRVLCSTERPMTIAVDGDEYIVNRITPATYPDAAGILLVPDALYWAICHDTSATELSENETRIDRATQLGYSTNLETSRTRTDSVEWLEQRSRPSR